MGSCLTAEQRPAAAAAAAPGEKAGEGRKREEEAPGRIAGSGVGNAACLFTKQGKKGTNQDAMVVWENFNGRPDTIFCGVFDGHGPQGHLMARKVRDTLPSKLRDLIYDDYGDSPTSYSDGSVLEETLSPYADAEDKSPMAGQKEEHYEFFKTMKESFRKAFRITDKELKLNRNIDSICSGSTAVTLIKQGQDLIVGNVGDSRAVLGTRDRNGYLVAHQLTVDLKPDHPRHENADVLMAVLQRVVMEGEASDIIPNRVGREEVNWSCVSTSSAAVMEPLLSTGMRERNRGGNGIRWEARRIKRCNGRVFAHQDEPDVARLWLPNCNSPGLAMARAFGDFCLKDFGLISVPEVTYRRITEEDEFIVLATDGVWDVLSNQEVVETVASCSDRSIAARCIVELANQTWRFKYPTSKTDDCAVICLFLDNDAGLSASSVTRRGTGSSPRMPARSRNPRSKRVVPEEADDGTDSNVSGDERSLEGFTRLNTLLTLPKFGDTSPTKK
ncbi:hypothetical protein ACP70R_002585 [Stipagrostis hirtigluma subsp. patula]